MKRLENATPKKILFTSHIANFQKFNRPFMQMFRGTLEGEYTKFNCSQPWEVHYASTNEEKILDADKSFTVDFARNPFRIDKHIKAYSQLKKILQNNTYDIIHTHTPVGSVITRLAARKARKSGTRVIYTAHGFHFYKGASLINWLIWYPVEKIMAHFTDDIITINTEDYDRAKKKLKSRIHYTPGVGIDSKKFQIKMTKKERDEYRATLGLKPDDFVMIYVAELIPRKNHTKIIKDFGDYLSISNGHLLFVGKPTVVKKLQKVVFRKKLSDHIHFIGYRNDIPQLLTISDLYISTCREEGLGLNVIEAKISGLHTLITRVRGHNDIVSTPPKAFFLENALSAHGKIYGTDGIPDAQRATKARSDNADPKVSILMPVFNCEEYIASAIDSILDQSYEDWELILCDDGSSDGTYSVAKQYAEKYPKKLILLKNGINLKLNKSLNKCLSHASGSYIARMDGDDIVESDKLRKEVNFLDDHPDYALVSCQMDMFNESGKLGTAKFPTGEIKREDFIRHPAVFCHSGMMIRKKALIDVGGYSEGENYIRVEDIDLWLKLYENKYKGYGMPEVLYHQRDDENAANRRTRQNYFNEYHIRKRSFRSLCLPKTKYYYVFRPLVIAFIPKWLYKILHIKCLEGTC